MNIRSQTQKKQMKYGATLTLSSDSSPHEQLARLLEQMHEAGFNTVNFYGLEHAQSQWERVFRELARLNMQAVVRIEDYGPDFSFSKQDIPLILQRYQTLMDFVCLPGNRAQIAYFSLNMPVDDGRVTDRLGGVNALLCTERQKEYASAFVSAVRMETHRRGFHNVKLYLSVFYGWDGSYHIPSYAQAGADGYFVNNYSYPAKDGQAPALPAADAQLINQARLEKAVRHFQKQYPGMPLVIEFGFHTLEYNGGRWPNQTAGLVADRAAKRRAIEATLRYYETVPEYEGFLYFGYNLYKEEGDPPAVMDWTLVYPEQQEEKA